MPKPISAARLAVCRRNAAKTDFRAIGRKGGAVIGARLRGTPGYLIFPTTPLPPQPLLEPYRGPCPWMALLLW